MAEKLEMPAAVIARLVKEGASESLAATGVKDHSSVIINKEAK